MLVTVLPRHGLGRWLLFYFLTLSLRTSRYSSISFQINHSKMSYSNHGRHWGRGKERSRQRDNQGHGSGASREGKGNTMLCLIDRHRRSRLALFSCVCQCQGMTGSNSCRIYLMHHTVYCLSLSVSTGSKSPTGWAMYCNDQQCTSQKKISLKWLERKAKVALLNRWCKIHITGLWLWLRINVCAFWQTHKPT